MSRRGTLLFAAMCVIWGVPYLLIRVAVREMSPADVVVLRTGGAALVLFPFALRQASWRPLLHRWRLLLLYTAVELAVPWWLLTTAEEHLSSALSGLLIAAVPLLGVVLARASGDTEPIGRVRLAGLGVGIVGVAALVGLQVGHVDLLAVGAVLLTAVGYAAGPIVLSRGLSDLPAVGVVWTSLVLTAIVWSPAVILSPPSQVSAHAALAVVGLAVVCSAVAFLLFFALIAEVGPARATVITYVNPAVAILLGVLVLGERFTTGIAVGFPLVLAGSVLATRRTVAVPGPEAAAELPPPPLPDVVLDVSVSGCASSHSDRHV
ncbi:MAG TPA: DMT family transporter [Mycobacteriales bacterium]|nr:DMT family transporter [Mycobacteriales bacterium]